MANSDILSIFSIILILECKKKAQNKHIRQIRKKWTKKQDHRKVYMEEYTRKHPADVLTGYRESLYR